MLRPEHLRNFEYQFLNGPLPYEEVVEGHFKGNCRAAVQEFYYQNFGLFLNAKALILPEADKSTGPAVSIFRGDTNTFFNSLEYGDIVYADKLRDSKGRLFKPKLTNNSCNDEWQINLHLGVYLGILSPYQFAELQPEKSPPEKDSHAIWHASFIAGGTALWSTEKFCYYYQPVLAKRVLPQKQF